MWLHVYSEGFTGNFNQYVEINCVDPIKSHLIVDRNNISLKESMAYSYTPWDEEFRFQLDRGAVEDLFSYYCS